MLEKSHRFCLKFIQCIPKYTMTDICVSLIGSRNICFEIEQRKLFFYGKTVLPVFFTCFKIYISL